MVERRRRSLGWSTVALVLAAIGCDKGSASRRDTEANAAPRASSADPAAAPSAAPAVSAGAEPVDVGSKAIATAVVREERRVVVAGATETWRLEWVRPPIPTCVDESWSTCACAGWELGERGDLDLVRVRPRAAGGPRDAAGGDVVEERLHLNPVFGGGEGILPRWPVLPRDRGKAKIDWAEIAPRTPVRVMTFGDYDHDGHATEFVLQVDADACGHAPAVVIGVDARNPKLHVFAPKAKPNEWITLERRSDWEAVRAKVPVTLTEVACGDHGAEERVTLAIAASPDGLDVTKTTERCR